MKNVLKVWLKKFGLTSDPNDYTGVVLSAGKVDMNDVVDAIIEEGTEYQKESIIGLITRYNRHCARFVLNGYNVDTGLVYLRALVTGIFYGKKYDKQVNRVYVSATQGKDLRNGIAETELEILGQMPDMIYILRVTNLLTKTDDGTLPRGRNAQIDGACIKLAGEDPAVGVYLVNLDDDSEVKLAPEDIVTNKPASMIIYIPSSLPEGTYRIRIVTQFTVSNKLLKSPRECISQQELVVI